MKIWTIHLRLTRKISILDIKKTSELQEGNRGPTPWKQDVNWTYKIRSILCPGGTDQHMKRAFVMKKWGRNRTCKQDMIEKLELPLFSDLEKSKSNFDCVSIFSWKQFSWASIAKSVGVNLEMWSSDRLALNVGYWLFSFQCGVVDV